MPLGPGIRYRVKHTSKGMIRLAFRGNKVVEATKMKKGGLKEHLAGMIQAKKFKKGKRKTFAKKKAAY